MSTGIVEEEDDGDDEEKGEGKGLSIWSLLSTR